MSGLIKVLVFEVPYEEFSAKGISLEDIGDVEDVWNFTSDCADHIESYLFRFNTINPSSPILTEELSSSSKEPLKEKSLNNKSNEVSNARSTSNCSEKEALATTSLDKKEVKNLKAINCSTWDENFEDVKILKLHKKKTSPLPLILEENEHVGLVVKERIEKEKVDDFSVIRQKKTESKSEAREDKQERESVLIAEPSKDENEAISRDEMLSAASEIIKDRNDLIEKLEQELSELRTRQQMGVAQALQALLFMFLLYVAFYCCDLFCMI